MSWKTPVFFVLAVLIVCLVSYAAGRVKGRRIGRDAGYEAGFAAGYDAPHPGDTSVHTDTIYIDRPVPTSTKPAGMEFYKAGTLAAMQARLDSLLAIKPDTAFVELPVPIESVRYGGQPGDEYSAQISGWHPTLDWIEVYPKTAYITPPTPGPDKRKPRISFGATAGPGVIWDGSQIRAGIGATGGLTIAF